MPHVEDLALTESSLTVGVIDGFPVFDVRCPKITVTAYLKKGDKVDYPHLLLCDDGLHAADQGGLPHRLECQWAAALSLNPAFSFPMPRYANALAYVFSQAQRISLVATDPFNRAAWCGFLDSVTLPHGCMFSTLHFCGSADLIQTPEVHTIQIHFMRPCRCSFPFIVRHDCRRLILSTVFGPAQTSDLHGCYESGLWVKQFLKDHIDEVHFKNFPAAQFHYLCGHLGARMDTRTEARRGYQKLTLVE